MIKTYIKKPLTVQAVQWMGDNTNEIIDFGGTVNGCNTISDIGECYLVVRTLEGDLKISLGDYVIRGTSGEYYPCKPDIFEKIYEEQDDMTCKGTITWHEVKTRPLTDEEQDQHPTWGMMVEGAMPQEGEEILVATKRGCVIVDTCLYDYDEGYYLDSGNDWDGIFAWTSMPKYRRAEK